MVKRPSIGAELHHLDVDKTITTDPGDHSKRRTLQLIKKNNSWGFTLQTYGINHKHTQETEIMTYVDYVDYGGSAWMAGMRRGDVILSVNGEKVGEINHQQLVNKIRQAGNTLRLVVLFEDCCKKVDLHERFIKLKSVLKSKVQELKEIELQEMELFETKGLNRFEQIRQSILSDKSSSSDSWDAYSVVSSPYALKSTGHFDHSQWSSATSLKSFSMGDNSDIVDDEYSFMDSESDNESITMATPGAIKPHGSDSNLIMKNGASNFQRLKVKDVRLSDSTLYRRSFGTENDLHRQRSLQKVKGRDGSSQSLRDEVFEEEDNGKVVSEENGKEVSEENGQVVSEKNGQVVYEENGNVVSEENGQVVSEENGKMVSEENGKVVSQENVDKCETEASLESGISRNISIGNVKDLTLREHQVFYSGENGSIIVPKICLDGEEVFTTFAHIDTSENLEDLPAVDQDIYQDKIVAIEIAKEMAKLDKTDQNMSMESISDENIPDTFAKSLNTMNGDRTGRRTPSPKLGVGRERISQSNGVNSPQNSQSYINGAFGTKRSPKMATKTSPKIGRNNVPNIGGSLPYEQLKSSIPDIRISFHTDNCEVIYINDKDETTKL